MTARGESRNQAPQGPPELGCPAYHRGTPLADLQYFKGVGDDWPDTRDYRCIRWRSSCARGSDGVACFQVGWITRWSAITGIITAAFTVLAFVVSVVPLAFRHEHKSEQDENNRVKQPGDVVTQQINNYGAGTVNAVAKGIQIVGHRHKLPKNDR